MHSSIRNVIAAHLLVLAVVSPALAKSTAHRNFGGTLLHVSKENIKVKGTEGGKVQILSFTGNFTKQKGLVAGTTFVCVTYDQKLLGIRHADAVAVGSCANPVKH